jgi:glucuronoarabinoxylan endo-1,4-beta-xylanase
MKLVARQLPKPPIEITVNPAIQYQNITGFGGMLNPALWLGSNQLTEEEIQQLYSSSGLGYNMIRMMIYPDPANWQRDVAVALKAQSLGVRILASPWTPPAALKSNNNQVGGHLLPENYQAYVDHLNAFVDYMASRGITIEAVSIQNEPDILVSYDGCEWTREELRIFMRDYAGQIKARVIAAESFNFKQDYTDQILNDAVAEKNLDIVGGHLYGGGLKDYPLARNKGKEIWMTEHLMNEVNNGMGWEQAMIFAKEVHDCMAANFNAYIWWYLKRHYSMLGDGEHGAVVGQTLKRGYILSHYAKYATGRKRVQVSSITGNSNVLITAYESEHDITLVLINQGQETVPSLKINLSTVINSATAIETSDTDNMANHTITVSADKKSTITSVPAQSVVSIRLTK